MEIARLEEVYYRYSTHGRWILKGVNFVVHSGDRLLVAGNSGSGKTTLLRVVSGLAPRVYGGEIRGLVETSGSMVLLPQFFDAYMLMPTVEEELAYVASSKGVSPLEVRTRVRRIAEDLGIEGILGRRISSLSTGERQRVAIASALLMEPDAILLDEPLAYLDPIGVKSLLNTLARLDLEAIVVSEHRIHYLKRWASRLVLMDEGVIVFDGTVDGYGEAWLECSLQA